MSKHPAEALSGIVLAGGRSARFGRAKLAEPLDGAPLVQHAIRALAALCDEVIVVGSPDAGPGAFTDPARGSATGVRVVPDPETFGGPLVGLLAGLEVMAAPTVLVAAGDMPRLQEPVLRLLVSRLRSDADADAVVLRHQGERRPLPMAVRQGAAIVPGRRLIGLGERSLRAFLDRIRTVAIDEAEWRALDPAAETMRDVDRPADLRGL